IGEFGPQRATEGANRFVVVVGNSARLVFFQAGIDTFLDLEVSVPGAFGKKYPTALEVPVKKYSAATIRMAAAPVAPPKISFQGMFTSISHRYSTNHPKVIGKFSRIGSGYNPLRSRILRIDRERYRSNEIALCPGWRSPALVTPRQIQAAIRLRNAPN